MVSNIFYQINGYPTTIFHRGGETTNHHLRPSNGSFSIFTISSNKPPIITWESSMAWETIIFDPNSPSLSIINHHYISHHSPIINPSWATYQQFHIWTNNSPVNISPHFLEPRGANAATCVPKPRASIPYPSWGADGIRVGFTGVSWSSYRMSVRA